MRTIEIEKKLELETEPLDYALLYNEEDSEIIYKGENVNFLDSFPIKVEDIEKLLFRIKESGSNYVSINYNVDKYQYTLEGYKVTKSI